jgi:hypothetical protein
MKQPCLFKGGEYLPILDRLLQVLSDALERVALLAHEWIG